MWKYLIVTLSVFVALVYGGYHLYMFDKQPTSVEPATDLKAAKTNLNKAETSLPPYLTNSFWEKATPQELEIQLKGIVNVNEVRPNDKKSMLHLLAIHGVYPEMVKMLIEAGVDYRLRDEVKSTKIKGWIDNRTALFYAGRRKNKAYEFIEALLEYDDVNSYVNDRGTVLLLAVHFRRPINMIQMLLQQGADPNLQSLVTQDNSLISASSPNKITGVSYINPEVIQLLLDYKADITAKDTNGKNAFDYMKENEEFRNTELFKKLSAQFPQ